MIFKLACSLRGQGWDYEVAKYAVLGASGLCKPPFPEEEALQKLDNAWKYPAPAESVNGPWLDEVDGDDGGPMPFPVDALPEVVARFVREAAAAIVTPPEYIAVPLLVSAGTAIGDRLEIAPKAGWTEGPNLFAACVGKPGAKKSPSMKTALVPFERLTARLGREHEAKKERWRQAHAAWQKHKEGPEPIKPTYPHRWTADTTVEALVPMLGGSPGVLLQMDELSAWVGSMDQYKNGKGADREHYLSLWNRGRIKVDRRGHIDDPIVVEHPTLSVVGGIQPDRLPGLANAAGNDGFLDRLLWAYPDPMPSGIWTEEVVSYEAADAVTNLFELLDGLPYDPGDYNDELALEVCFDADAKRRWVQWYNAHGEEADAVADILNGVWNKMPSQFLRLTLILHAIGTVRPKDQSVKGHSVGDGRVDAVVDPKVSLQTVESAITLIDYFKAHARRAYRLLGKRRQGQGESAAPRDIRREKILRALREHGRMTKSQILRDVFKRNLTADDVKRLLEEMEADGEIEQEVESVDTREITYWKVVDRPTAEAA